MEDELAAVRREIFGDSRSSSPILRDGPNKIYENALDDILTISEDENCIEYEINKDDLLSKSVKKEEQEEDFEGFECSFDPEAFEIDYELTKDRPEETAKNESAEDKDSDDEFQLSAEQQHSLRILEDINDCLENSIDGVSSLGTESTENREKSTKESCDNNLGLDSENSGRERIKLKLNLKRLSTESEEKDEEIPLKRNRKKASFDLPTFSATPQENELEMGFRILKQLISFPGSTSFLDKPDATAHGMSNYYSVIKKPMWLNEVMKLYNEEKYPNITELIADLRLILENCYRYWGAGDPLSKKALRVEELLEKKLATLPSHIRDLCSLKATHGEDANDRLSEEKEKTDEQFAKVKRSCQILKKRVFVSHLMQRVVDSYREVDSTALKPPVIEKVPTEVEDWENRVLYSGNAKEQIQTMWELPLIGQFLYLTVNILNIGTISQFEIERMLLIPQESTALAKIMTSMLIAPFSRARLEKGPPMPYIFWTRKLKNKVSHWYRTYRSTGDQSVKVFEMIGIGPEFWLVMGENNPLDESEFHELSFIQRVWVLKSLCDYLLHNYKYFQEHFNNIDPEDLRESYLGKDKQGSSYHYFPEFNEVRIYKRSKIPDKKWNEFDSGVEEMIINAAEDVEYPDEKDTEDDFIVKIPRSMLPSPSRFKMVASTVDDVRCLIKHIGPVKTTNTSSGLIESLRSTLTAIEPIESNLLKTNIYLREKMYKEWLQFNNRPRDFVDPGMIYWSRSETHDKEEKSKEDSTEIAENIENNIIEKRERRSARESQKYIFDELEKHLGFEGDGEEYQPMDDEDSEDEWVASPSKKKKKQQNVSQKKIKKLESLTQQMQDKGIVSVDNLNQLGKTRKIQNVSGIQPDPIISIDLDEYMNANDVKIKTEPQELQLSNTQNNTSQAENSSLKMPKIRPPPPTIPIQQYLHNSNVKQENDNDSATRSNMTIKKEFPGSNNEYLDYSSIKIKSEPASSKKTVIRLKSMPSATSSSTSSDVINLLSDDEDDSTDVIPVFNEVKPWVKTLELVTTHDKPRTLQQPPQLPPHFNPELENKFSQKTVFINPKQVVSPANSSPQAFQQLLPVQTSPQLVYQQRNIVQTPPQKSASFPNNSPLIQQLTSPNRSNSPSFQMNQSNTLLQNVKQEPGTVHKQFTNNASPQQSKMLSPVPQQNRLQSSPQVRSALPANLMSSPRGRPRGQMMSPRMPAPISQPQIRSPNSQSIRSPINQRRMSSPMLQRGRMPMSRGSPQTQAMSRGSPQTQAMSRGSPQTQTMPRGSPQSQMIRQRSPQAFPQQRGMSPQVSSPFGSLSPLTPNRRLQATPPSRGGQFNNTPSPTAQARRNLNFNSPGRPATNTFSSPTNQHTNTPKERLHIINTGSVFGKNTKTVEGKLVVALNDDGNYGYFVTLSDGGKVTLTMKQINELRAKCNGTLPDKVGIPMVITD